MFYMKASLLNNVSKSINMDDIQASINDNGLGVDGMNMTPEVILQHWFNLHLKKAGYKREVKNWSTDICDRSVFSSLLLISQISIISIFPPQYNP